MRVLGWVVVALSSLLVSGSSVRFPQLPDAAPLRVAAPDTDPLIRLRVLVDEAFVAGHGENFELFLHEIVAIQNVEWRRVRPEWFAIDSIVVEPSSRVRDASWLLATLVLETAHEPGTIQVRITGHPLETYSNGVSAKAIGGLAYRGSDVVVISAGRGVSAELAAYYLFHEIGHCWDAFDLPFGGGHSTFGNKRFATFDVDAGNGQIIEDSPGPRPRDTSNLAPAFIRGRLAKARRIVKDPHLYRKVHDLLLHEASPANPAWVKKRRAVLATAGKERRVIANLLKEYEITPGQARAEAASRRQIAEYYWIVNDAVARGDLVTAETALVMIDCLDNDHSDTHRLLAAVGKKVRRVGRT